MQHILHKKTGQPVHPSLRSRAPLWLRFHLISLDAPLVALIWQAFLSRLFHANLQWPVYVALGASVWLIYVADRLLDSRHASGPLLTARHQFYSANRRSFLPFLLAAGGGTVFVCQFLHAMTLRNGLALGLLVGLYFAIVHVAPQTLQQSIPKELVVGIIFSAGTCLATCTELGAWRLPFIAAASLFAMLCWLNCVAIESWERKLLPRGSATPPHKLTVWMGGRLAPLCLLIFVGCGVLGAIPPLRFVSAVGALSAAALLLIDAYREHLPVEALHLLADLSLLTPALFLPFLKI